MVLLNGANRIGRTRPFIINDIRLESVHSTSDRLNIGAKAVAEYSAYTIGIPAPVSSKRSVPLALGGVGGEALA